MRTTAAAILVLLAAACASPAPAQPTADEIENGRVIAQTQCAACHAVGRTGESPRAEAPPLRTVLARYDADQLEADLNEGIRVGHPDMPEFQIPIRGLDTLMAYLQSIQETPEE